MSAAAALLARAHHPDSFVVLRRRLVPLCLGHFAWFRTLDLERIRNPGELGLAVIVCSMAPSAVARCLHSPWFNLRLLWWRRQLGIWDMPRELAVFNRYIRHHTEVPEIASKNTPSTPSAIPFDQHLRMLLIGRLGYDPATVEDVPFLMARWDYLAFCEFEGWLNVQDFGADDIDKAIRELDMEAVKAAGARLLAEGKRNGRAKPC